MSQSQNRFARFHLLLIGFPHNQRQHGLSPQSGLAALESQLQFSLNVKASTTGAAAGLRVQLVTQKTGSTWENVRWCLCLPSPALLLGSSTQRARRDCSEARCELSAFFPPLSFSKWMLGSLGGNAFVRADCDVESWKTAHAAFSPRRPGYGESRGEPPVLSHLRVPRSLPPPPTPPPSAGDANPAPEESYGLLLFRTAAAAGDPWRGEGGGHSHPHPHTPPPPHAPAEGRGGARCRRGASRGSARAAVLLPPRSRRDLGGFGENEGISETASVCPFPTPGCSPRQRDFLFSPPPIVLRCSGIWAAPAAGLNPGAMNSVRLCFVLRSISPLTGLRNPQIATFLFKQTPFLGMPSPVRRCCLKCGDRPLCSHR